jgi:hypothetical protein
MPPQLPKIGRNPPGGRSPIGGFAVVSDPAAWLDRFVRTTGPGLRSRGRARFLTAGLGALAAAAAVTLIAPAPSFAQAAPPVAVSGGALADVGRGALLWSQNLGSGGPWPASPR